MPPSVECVSAVNSLGPEVIRAANFEISFVFQVMAARAKKRTPAAAEPSLFDPRGEIRFPPRVEVLRSVHGNQVFGLAHAAVFVGVTAPALRTAHFALATLTRDKGFNSRLEPNFVNRCAHHGLNRP
jgi:hypothetical protein